VRNLVPTPRSFSAWLSARSGREEETDRTAVAHAQEACKQPDDCTLAPGGKKRQFASLEEVPRWFLRQHGGID
jgi:hypothetical protein